jgi:hypothetical protein
MLASEFCYFHAAETRELHRESAARGGRGGAPGEIAALKARLRQYEELRAPTSKPEIGNDG